VNPLIRQEIYAWRTPRDPAAQEIEPQGLHIRGRTALAEKVLANEEQRRRKLDLTGHIYGRLTVLYRVKIGGNTWMCRCECGKHKEIGTWALRGHHSKSCGCLRLEVRRRQADAIRPKAVAAIKAKSAARKLKARKAAA
jgi:hypothetical protein